MMLSIKTKRRVSDAVVTTVALCIGLVIIFPILYCILSAFKTRGEFTTYPPTLFPKELYWGNFVEALQKTPLLRFMLNSLIMAAIGSTVRIIFASLAAYAFAFYDFKGKNILFFIVLGTMMLPADALIITNYLTVSKLNLLDNYIGMGIIYFVGATQMFMLRQSFKSIPRALREAAELDGCGDIRFLLRILLPVARPVIMTLFVQSFVTLWNAYLWPLLVTNKTEMRTVQVGITMLTTATDINYNLVMAAVAIILVPSFILFIILRRNIVKGIMAGALVG